MRVLFLDHPEGDFLSAEVFWGLHEILGPEGVVDFPYKKSFHGGLDTYPSCYPSGHGDPIGTTGPFSWMPNLPGRDWSEEDVVRGLNERKFDLVVLASPRTYNTRDLRRLIGRVGRDRMPKIVLVDGEDYDRWHHDLCDEFKPHVYFKRELFGGGHCSGVPIEPFPFCSPLPVMPEVAKDIDVLFLAGKTHANREKYANALRDAFGNRVVSGHFGYADYLNAMNRARVAVSVRGWGQDTLRYWEIPSFENTLLVADKLPLMRPYPFVHGETCLYFEDPKGLVDAVRCALEDEPWRERIARAGNAHLRAHHTTKARAQQLLDRSARA